MGIEDRHERDAEASSLRITRLEAIPVEVPWKNPDGSNDARAYRWAFGVKESGAAVLVRVETEEGHVGWGETACLFHPMMPALLLQQTVESLAGFVVGRRAAEIERILATAYSRGGWHFGRGFGNYALSGIEMALWDVIGQAAGMPVSDLLGGRTRDEVEFMYFVYSDDLPAMCADARSAVEEGYKCVYLKVGSDPKKDLDLIAAVRDVIGFDVQLRIDANEAWSPGMAVRMINALAGLDLEFVEQPVLADDVVGLAEVRGRVAIPICADQAARTPAAVLNVINNRAADIVSICPSDAGGLLAARKSAAIAEAAGLPVFIHSNVELGLATAAHLQLASVLPNCHYASQTEHQFLDGDIIAEGSLKKSGGRMEVPTAPGLGVGVDLEKVKWFHERFVRGLENGRDTAATEPMYLPGY